MKRKISAILTSAMMIIGSMVSTVSALSLDEEIWVDGEPLSFEEYLEICTPDEYRIAIGSVIASFIRSENLDAQVLYDVDEVSCNYVNENGENVIIINYYYTHTDVKPAVEAFIEENNLDSSLIVFQSVGSEELDPSEEITEPYLILALIDDFIDENNIDASVSMNNYATGLPTFEVTGYLTDNIIEDIKIFIKEKNIDENRFTFLCYEQDDIFVVLAGDADGDNELTVRDCSLFARKIAGGKATDIPNSADFNGDGEVNVRDAAAIATHLASK